MFLWCWIGSSWNFYHQPVVTALTECFILKFFPLTKNNCRISSNSYITFELDRKLVEITRSAGGDCIEYVYYEVDGRRIGIFHCNGGKGFENWNMNSLVIGGYNSLNIIYVKDLRGQGAKVWMKVKGKISYDSSTIAPP